MVLIAGLPPDLKNELLGMGLLVVTGGGAALMSVRLKWVSRLCFVSGVAVFFLDGMILPLPRNSFFGPVQVAAAILMVAPVGVLAYETARGGEGKAAHPKSSDGWDEELVR